MQLLDENENKNAFLLFAQVDKNTNTLKPWLHCYRFFINCAIVILNFPKRQCGSWMAHLCFCCSFLSFLSPSIHNDLYHKPTRYGISFLCLELLIFGYYKS